MRRRTKTAASLAVLIALTIPATLRATRFVTTDSLGGWMLRDPAYKWASKYEPPHEDPEPRSKQARLVSGLDCAACAGFWIGGIVLGSGLLARSLGGPVWAIWRFGAGVFGLNYVVFHIARRLD